MERNIVHRPLRRRTFLGGIAGSAAAAILAACGGSGSPTSTPAPTAAPATGSVAAPTAAAASRAVAPSPTIAGAPTVAAPTVGAPATTAASTTATGSVTAATTGIYSPQGTKAPNFADKQVLRLSLAADPKTLDPALGQYANDIGVMRLMYDALYAFDDKANLIPRAAAEVPTQQNGGISPDGKTYTIKLRPGQKFSDGSPVAARDYVYASKRFVSPATASNYASFLSGLAGYRELHAEGNEKKSAQELQPLVDKLGIAAKDDTTLVFTLADVQPTFPQVLSLWGLAPLKQSAIQAGGEGWWKDPKAHVTNGAWMMESFASNQKLAFVPNPAYTGEKPYLTRIEYSIIASSAQLWSAYQNNELDFVVDVPPGNRQQVLADPAYKNQILRTPQLGTLILQFNDARAPFDNPAVRKAFATAIDREAYVRDIEKGVGHSATSWVAPGEPGYNGDIGRQYAFDAAKAKKILADAKVDPKSLAGIKFLHSTAGSQPLVAQFFQQQIRTNLGVEMQLDPQEENTAIELVADKKDYQITNGGWFADYPDPDDWLPQLFGTEGGNNQFGYSNPQADALFKRAAVELDNTKRLALYAQAEQIIVDDDCGIAPIYNLERLSVHKPNLVGIVGNPMDAHLGDVHAYRGFQFIKK